MSTQVALKVGSNVCAASGVSSGVFAAVMGYLNSNAAGMGVLCSIISIMLFAYFRNKEMKNKSRDTELSAKMDKIIQHLDGKG